MSLICIYFATKLSFKQIIKKKVSINQNFKIMKDSAHAQGKTIRHRNGAKESSKSKVRTACQKLDQVLFYKKQIQKMPELLECLEGINIPMELLNPWLYGDMPSAAFKKFF